MKQATNKQTKNSDSTFDAVRRLAQSEMTQIYLEANTADSTFDAVRRLAPLWGV